MAHPDADPGAMSRRRPPKVVWIVSVVLGLMAFVSIVGSFLFAFPLGGALGYTMGSFLIAVGIGYAAIAWHLRRGERPIWIAAIVLPIVHTLTLNTVDLVRRGKIPSEDYPFMAISAIIVILLLLPSTRRFFR